MNRRVRLGGAGAAAAAVMVLGAQAPVAYGAGQGDADRLTLDRLGRDGPETLDVGSAFEVRAGFTHHGKRPLRRIVISLDASEGLSFTREYRNCVYGTEARNISARAEYRALCLIRTRVEPGESIDLTPLSLKVGKGALEEHVGVSYAIAMQAPYSQWRNIHRGRGEELTAAPRTGVVPPDERRYTDLLSAQRDVSVDNAWDMEVKGAALKGRKGETLTARLALEHHGASVRAQLDAENSIPFARVEVRFPKGVKVVSVPEGCGRGDVRSRPPYYLCEYGLYTTGFDLPVLRDGFHMDFPFKVRIDDPSELGAGTVRVDAPAERLRDDADPGNSTAPITVEAIGASDGPGPLVPAAVAGAMALAGLLAFALVRRRAR
ncbi:hypothetical protein [Streptomyces murinus]|uniref:hypothetical protein n=1 Tax=Streptomyces murinus TaxID=33900 RepID=UPI002114F813|nr:hypothetical protein [Streptomyces murinus]